MTRALSNALYQERVAAMLLEVRKGTALSVALQRYPRHFPSLVTKMINVGELSGNLSETFEYLAEFYEDELDAFSKNLSTILEPVLLLVIGVLVAFMALSIILPIGNIIGGIHQ
jgi:type IV pilus assembly protein PilC